MCIGIDANSIYKIERKEKDTYGELLRLWYPVDSSVSLSVTGTNPRFVFFDNLFGGTKCFDMLTTRRQTMPTPLAARSYPSLACIWEICKSEMLGGGCLLPWCARMSLDISLARTSMSFSLAKPPSKHLLPTTYLADYDWPAINRLLFRRIFEDATRRLTCVHSLIFLAYYLQDVMAIRPGHHDWHIELFLASRCCGDG